MTRSLPHRLANRTTLPVLFLLAGGVLLFYLVLFPGMTANPPALRQTGLLDTRLSYTPQQAYQALEAYGPEGRAQYARTTLLLDFLFPVIYALLLSLLATRGLLRAFPGAPRLHRLALLPFAVLLCDWLENGCILALLWTFPQRLLGLATAAGTFTLLKWIGLALAVLIAGGSNAAVWLRPSPNHQ